MENKINNTQFCAIVAMDLNRTIGKNNQLLWHLPADWKHFKKLTSHHPILMGRKTFLSIGRPLPQRENIVLTRNNKFSAPDITIIHSLQEAFCLNLHYPPPIFIIGGAEIYQQFLPYLSIIYMTIVHHRFDGDTFFPSLNSNEWEEQARETYAADDKNKYDHEYLTLRRIR